jgi:hypothetical protein
VKRRGSPSPRSPRSSRRVTVARGSFSTGPLPEEAQLSSTHSGCPFSACPEIEQPCSRSRTWSPPRWAARPSSDAPLMRARVYSPGQARAGASAARVSSAGGGGRPGGFFHLNTTQSWARHLRLPNNATDTARTAEPSPIDRPSPGPRPEKGYDQNGYDLLHSSTRYQSLLHS